MGKGFGCPKNQQKSIKSKKNKESNDVLFTQKELELKAEYYVTHRTLDGFQEYLDHVREQSRKKMNLRFKKPRSRRAC